MIYLCTSAWSGSDVLTNILSCSLLNLICIDIIDRRWRTRLHCNHYYEYDPFDYRTPIYRTLLQSQFLNGQAWLRVCATTPCCLHIPQCRFTPVINSMTYSTLPYSICVTTIFPIYSTFGNLLGYIEESNSLAISWLLRRSHGHYVIYKIIDWLDGMGLLGDNCMCKHINTKTV